MLADILITLPLVGLFVLIAWRCLEGWGLALPCSPGWEEPTGPQGPSAPSWKIFSLALALRGGMFLLGLGAVVLQNDQALSLSQAVESLCRWDSYHYKNLAELGYSGYMENGQHLFLVFYPGYVWLLRAVKLVIPHTYAAGIVLSSLCFAGGCVFLYKMCRLYAGHAVARDAVLLLCFYPFSFFFGEPMTEGLFLLTTGGALYSAARGKWLSFALWGLAACLTRMTGLLVLVPGVWELLRPAQPLARPLGASLLRGGKALVRKLPLLLLPLLGAGAYLLLNFLVDGDPFAFLTHQQHWYQGGMWISSVLRYVWKYLCSTWGTANSLALWLPTLALFLLSFALLVWGALRDRKTSPGLLAYGFCVVIANYALSWLLSAGRYLSCAVPLFLLGARFLADKPNLRRAVLLGEAALLGICYFAHLSGAQIM